MHLRREIDELLDETITIQKELNKQDNSNEKFIELATQLDEIKDKIKDKTREGRCEGLWTDSPEFFVKSLSQMMNVHWYIMIYLYLWQKRYNLKLTGYTLMM